MNDDIRAIEIMQDNAEHAADRPTDAEWVKARAGIIGVEKHYEDIGASTGSLEVIRAIDKCLRYSDTLRAISPPEPTDSDLLAVFKAVEQRLNESGTGEMGLLDTIHAVYALVKPAIAKAESRAMPLQERGK